MRVATAYDLPRGPRPCAIAAAMAAAENAWRKQLTGVTIADSSSTVAGQAPGTAARIERSPHSLTNAERP
jgi:hypothetical protein